VPFVICLHTVHRSRDAVWNVESRGSREHVLHGNVDAIGRGTFGGVVCSAKFLRNVAFKKLSRKILHFFPRNMLCPGDCGQLPRVDPGL